MDSSCIRRLQLVDSRCITCLGSVHAKCITRPQFVNSNLHCFVLIETVWRSSYRFHQRAVNVFLTENESTNFTKGCLSAEKRARVVLARTCRKGRIHHEWRGWMEEGAEKNSRQIRWKWRKYYFVVESTWRINILYFPYWNWLKIKYIFYSWIDVASEWNIIFDVLENIGTHRDTIECAVYILIFIKTMRC